MYDLETFRERVTQLYRAADPFEDGHRPTQGELADAVGLARAELNRRLHGKAGYRLTADNARAIIRTLAKWGAIQTQAAAIELLNLVECRPFSDDEWQQPPLNQLAPSAQHSALSAQHSASDNLPLALTSFVGREAEIAQCRQLLTETCLLTITGAGGVGKTRLAIEVAAGLRGSYTDGIWLVKLAALTDPHLVPQLVAATLGVREEANRPLVATLSDYLHHSEALLILDNCEHLVGACALLARELLAECPRLQIMATSREALGVPGETDWRLPSLSLPDAHKLPALDDLRGYEAVQLFSQRARAAAPSFKLTDKNAAAVVEVCQRLDGIPLAIELAAPLVKALSVPKIAQRLDDRFSLLTRGDRTAMPRQQTLRASIEWSYELLSEPERILLRRLAVFAGGWQLEAAEAVCSDEQLSAVEVLSGHIQLVSKSLLVAEGKYEKRYRMLETIREFAAERLAQSGEEEAALRRRHALLYLALAEEAAERLTGVNQLHWLNRLAAEHDNLRAALHWMLEHNEGALALRTSGALARFWQMRGYLNEGMGWLQASLAAGMEAAPETKLKALRGIGGLAFFQGDYQAAQSFYLQSLQIARDLHDTAAIAAALNNLSLVAMEVGDYPTAEKWGEESLALKRQLNDGMGVASTLSNLGAIAGLQGERDKAIGLFQESLDVARALGNREVMANALGNLGVMAVEKKDYIAARHYYEQDLQLAHELDNPLGLAKALNNLASVAYYQNDYSGGAALYARALAMEQTIGDKRNAPSSLRGLAFIALAQQLPIHATVLLAAAIRLDADSGSQHNLADQREYDARLDVCRAQLDASTFGAAYAQGNGMTLVQAIEYALEVVKDVTLVTDASAVAQG